MSRADLPTGTVTFLFTDIEGSTRLLSEVRDRYADVRAEHHRVIREAVEQHGGIEVDTQGDAFFVAFARASDAVAAAAAAQAALARGPVRVRMGLHTGEPSITVEGYVGIDVHRAARIGSAANGGQVLVSSATSELLGEETELRDLGEHRLKDFPAATRLFQVGNAEFPPLRTPDEARLPAPATPLVGRTKELRDALRLLREDKVRLLTVTGPGGVGKTRFAIEAASESLGSFTDGARFADLAPLRSADAVVPAIAQSVRAPGSVSETLQGQDVLLVLDNAEHVAAAAPELGSLLDSCPGVSMLVTSREPLHLSLERELPLRPMIEAPAVELFLQRGRMVDPDFEGDYPVLAEICGRLDGLPLAIELAASRVKVLGAEGLRDRLDRRLPLLVGRSRDVPERQRTLHATIEWSYDLLNSEEQRAFALVSVCVGGFTVDAAEVVAGADLDTLESLVEKSLIRQEQGRLAMLETIREYALQRLGTDGEEVGVRARHAEYYLALVAPLFEFRDLPDRAELLELVSADYDNLMAALAWFVQSGDGKRRLQLVLGCYLFWYDRGPWAEARRLTDAALASYQGDDVLRARGLWSSATFSWRLGLPAEGHPLALEALAIARDLGDQRLLFDCALTLGINSTLTGDTETSRGYYREAEAIARELGNPRLITVVLNNLGNVALDEHDYSTARAYLEEAVEIDRLHGLASSLANSLVDLGYISLAEGSDAEAVGRFRESLDIASSQVLDETLSWGLQGMAAVLTARGRSDAAATLLGASARLQEHLGVGDYYPIGREIRERIVASLREALGEAEFEETIRHGRLLSRDEAVRLAQAASEADA
jgi:predicted ATPase/class 3 adenylate cyclase